MNNSTDYQVAAYVPYTRLTENNVFTRLYLESKIRTENLAQRKTEAYKFLENRNPLAYGEGMTSVKRHSSCGKIHPEQVA
jgi:hypothetical protein